MSEDNYSLSSRVFHTIRENILSGKYATDEELKEKSIGEELGVSRTPVREALRQLELEGLVTIIPNKDNITKDQLDELEENIYLSDFHSSKGNSEQVVELDNKFHEILYDASGSKELRHILRDFHHYVQRVRKVTLAVQERAVNSNEEHRKIVEALKQHDGARAEELADAHMRNTINNMDHYGWDNLLKQ